MKRHSPTKKHSAPPAEAASSAQPNMAALGKMLEAMLAMCGASVPAVPSSGGGPVGEGAIVTVSASELVDAMLNRMYRRMPKSGTDGIPAECCPYSGLNRSALYEFMSLRDDDGNPVIKTVTLKGEKEKHGARFYSVGSVLSHLDRLAAKQSNEGTAKEDHGERP